MRTTLAEGALVTKGKVVFSDGLRAQISVGQPPKPEMNLYVDGYFVRSLRLQKGDEVIISLRREP